jgi:hypothetical protein
MPARNGADVGAYGGGTDGGVDGGATIGDADIIGCSGLAIAFARLFPPPASAQVREHYGSDLHGCASTRKHTATCDDTRDRSSIAIPAIVRPIDNVGLESVARVRKGPW